MDLMSSFYSYKSPIDVQPQITQTEIPDRRVEEKKKTGPDRRQPRPEIPNPPPKIVRKQRSLIGRTSAVPVSTTQPSGNIVSTTNILSPVTDSQTTSMTNNNSYQSPYNANPFVSSAGYRQQNPQQASHPQQTSNLHQSNPPRLPTPPVTSTVGSTTIFERPNSSSLTEICSSDDEGGSTQPIQQPRQTTVFNYVH